MPDLPNLDVPTPSWQTSATGAGAIRPDNANLVQRLRDSVLRITLISVAVVTVLGIAGVVAATTYGLWAALICLGVAVCCVAVVLISSYAVGSTVRTHAQWFRNAVPVANVPVPSSATQAAPVPSAFDQNPSQRREVFGKLARRLQSLVNRGIQRIDSLEREIEDPELLRGLYEIDHLTTRVRRQAENLAVLGGGAPQRRSTEPLSVYAVLRSAVAEIEHYKQVSIVPIEGLSLHGHVVAEIIHLLAELLENATTFTAPDAPKVMLRAQKVTAGLAIEIQDRGLGMTAEDLSRINRLLDGSASIDLGDLLSDGRIGLAVVKELAGRHGVRVQLQTNIFGGVDAAVVLPHVLLSDPKHDSGVAQHLQPVGQETRQETRQPVAAAAAVAVGAAAGRAEVAASSVLTMGLPAPAPAAPAPAGKYSEPAESFGPPAGYHDGAAEQPGSAARQPIPSLPVRTPGQAIPPSKSPVPPEPPAGFSPGEGIPAGSVGGPPPLPQRRGSGSHLRPELLEPPRATKPLPGHNTNLMATVQQGFERGRDARDNEPAQSPQPPNRNTEGESTAWPTT